MKIAVASVDPTAVLCDKGAWLADGFSRAGHDVRRVHSLADLQAADAQCDLIVLDQKGPFQHISTAELAEQKKSPWVICWRDLIRWDAEALADQDDLKLFGRLMRAVDIIFIKERSLIGEFASLGINAVYLDTQGCPAEMPPCSYREAPEFDVLVLGRTDYDTRRRDAQAMVSAGYRVIWAALPDSVGVPDGVTAHPWVHPTKELPALAGRCAMALSVDLRQDVPGYHSDRSFLLAGCGIPVIARVPEVDNEWGHSALAEIAPQADVASWVYSDTEGLLYTVDWTLKHSTERQRRGRNGWRAVMERHTYKQRAEQIVQAIFSS